MNEHNKLHALNGLSDMERIFFGTQHSRSRAAHLDSIARAAAYRSDTGTRRKLLQSTLSPAPSVAPSVAAPAAAPGPSFESPVEESPASYSMVFTIGTPAQTFVAIADTGSDLVWLQCAGCTECFNQSGPLFQPTNSSTYKNLGCSSACSALGTNELECTPKCEYTYSYGDKSMTQGYYSADTVTLESYNGTSATLIPQFNFGCGLKNKGTFGGVDGLVGLGRGPISFPSQIAPYLNNNKKFSYCLVDKSRNVTATSPIIFGEDAMPTNSSTVYTPLLSPFNTSQVPFYYLNLQGISVGGENLSIPASALRIDNAGNGGCIFDSGTTFTTLTDGAYDPLYNEVRMAITYPIVDLQEETGFDLCYDITGQSTLQYPDVVFQFENADFSLPFDNTFQIFSTGSSPGSSMYMCLAMMGGAGMNIFGNTQQQNFQIVYEVDELRVGWVPANCATF